jgi:hypothetical protein
MSELKTKRNKGDVEKFLKNIQEPRRRADGLALLDLMRQVTKREPEMWGDSIVGFGSYEYRNRSGRSGEWFHAGFAPRKRKLTLYLMAGLEELGDELSRLGKHKTGKACLYINRLDDVNLNVLRQVIEKSVSRAAKSCS